MTIPALTRTYYSDIDYPLNVSSLSTYCKNVLWAAKASMKKEILSTNCGAVTAWTCEGSSDASTAGYDGVDRLGSTFDVTKWTRVTNAGTPHTWIVLKHATLGIWFCLDYVGLADYNVAMWVSTAAFSGGTTSNRPTSASESQFGTNSNSTAFADSSLPASGAWMHRVFDSTGLFMLFHSRADQIVSTAFGFWPLDQVKSGDTRAWVAFFDKGSSNGRACLSSNSGTTGQWRNTSPGCVARKADNTGWVSVVPGFWMGASTTVWMGGTLTTEDAGDTQFAHASLYMVSLSSPTVKGRLADCYQTVVQRDGVQYPVNTSPQTHISIGNLFIPFSSTPRM